MAIYNKERATYDVVFRNKRQSPEPPPNLPEGILLAQRLFPFGE
jgi:hypothetical protein